MSSLVPGSITLLLKLDCTFTVLRLGLPPGQFSTGTAGFSLMVPAASSTLTLLSKRVRDRISPQRPHLDGGEMQKRLCAVHWVHVKES